MNLESTAHKTVALTVMLEALTGAGVGIEPTIQVDMSHFSLPKLVPARSYLLKDRVLIYSVLLVHIKKL